MRNPLITLSPEGRIQRIDTCGQIDRMACTEFYSGITVGGFPDDYRAEFRRMLGQSGTPLKELLAAFPDPQAGVAVVISGVDYDTMRLGAGSRIIRL